MHKLIEYVCEELDELERKAEKEGKLSMAEVQYMDTLAHAKKNLLKSEEMMDEYDGYSMAGRRGGREYEIKGSYARGPRRDAMGRYSRTDGYSMSSGEMIEELHKLMNDAPDDHTRMEFQKFIRKIETM